MATNLTMGKVKKLIVKANKDISKRTHIGEHQVTTTKHGCVVEWSNNLKKWKTEYEVKPGLHTIDANEIIIEAGLVETAFILQHLDILPLYKRSYEGRIEKQGR